MFDTVWQIFTSIVCCILIVRSLKLSRTEAHFDLIVPIIPLIAGATLVFYLVVIFTDLNEQYHDLFTHISALIRCGEYLVLLFGVEKMLKHGARRG